MKRFENLSLASLVVLAILCLLPLQQAFGQANDLRLGAVYIETNGAQDATKANQIVAYYRHGDGTLSEAGRFLTGGSGTGVRDFSSGSIVLTTIGRQQFLLVTNAGSNDVSVLSVQANGLTVASRVPAGGTHPASVAQHGNLVYVANQGSGNIAGFTIDSDGHLTAIQGSSRTLSGGGAIQVLFNNDGSVLVVTEQSPDAIDLFEVESDTGLTEGPRSNASAGVMPFGMLFDQFDHLLVTEGTNGAPIASMSSYKVKSNERLQTISGAVPTPHPFTCWLALTNANSFSGGQFGYTANFGDSTISSYFVSSDGSLVLKQAVATTTRSFPSFGAVDEAISNDGAFLYIADLGFVTDSNGNVGRAPGSLNAYAIAQDGSLVPIQQIGNLPHGVMGAAAR
jgi:6-phosphogluconolactonase (cycloisomerase 2 family)